MDEIAGIPIVTMVPSRDRHALILHRKCAHCGVTKPLNEECFPKKITKKTGFRGICIKCYERKERERSSTDRGATETGS